MAPSWKRMNILLYILDNIFYKEKPMKHFLKTVIAIGLSAMLLAGCGEEKQDPMEEIYAFVEAMNYDEALTKLGELDTAHKDRQEIYRLTGICHMGLGQYEEAVTALETALHYNNGFIREIDYDINQYLAVAYYNLGRFEDAAHVYSAIAKMQPKNAEVHYLYGITLLELGDYETSKEAFDKAVSLEPANYERIAEIYKAFYKFGYGDLGLQYVESALAKESGINDYDKGRLLYFVGRYSEAISSLEKVDQKKYKDTALYLGMSYEAMGDYNYAASIYSAGVVDSNNPALYNQLGLCQTKLRNYEEALKAFQDGLLCEDTTYHQSLRFNEAVTYEYLADFETAKKLMEAYLENYPNDAQAKREYQFLQTR